MLTRSFFARMGILLALTFGLAACGGQPTPNTWPGLAANDTTAFVASGQQVHAINLADGKPAWTFPAAASTEMGMFSATPGVSADVIIVAADGPANSYHGLLFGLNPATGQQQWCLSFSPSGTQTLGCRVAEDASASAGFLGYKTPTDNRVVGGIAITNQVAYLGLANGLTYAVDAGTGTVKWSFKANNAVWAVPLATEDKVYVPSLDHTLYALNSATGAKLWQKDLSAALASAPTLDNGTLYIGTFGNKVYALDAETGAEQWTFAANNWVWDSPVIQDGIMYLTDVGGTVYAVDIKTHAQTWAVKPGGIMRAAPVVVGDIIYVGDRTGQFFSINRTAPQSPSTQTIKGELIGSPLLVGDLLLIAPHKGDNLLVGYNALTGVPTGLAFAPSK